MHRWLALTRSRDCFDKLTSTHALIRMRRDFGPLFPWWQISRFTNGFGIMLTLDKALLTAWRSVLYGQMHTQCETIHMRIMGQQNRLRNNRICSQISGRWLSSSQIRKDHFTPLPIGQMVIEEREILFGLLLKYLPRKYTSPEYKIDHILCVSLLPKRGYLCRANSYSPSTAARRLHLPNDHQHRSATQLPPKLVISMASWIFSTLIRSSVKYCRWTGLWI